MYSQAHNCSAKQETPRILWFNAADSCSL